MTHTPGLVQEAWAHEEWAKEEQAKARIRAAAPALLEALERMVASHEDLAAYEAALAAIALAKGNNGRE